MKVGDRVTITTIQNATTISVTGRIRLLFTAAEVERLPEAARLSEQARNSCRGGSWKRVVAIQHPLYGDVRTIVAFEESGGNWRDHDGRPCTITRSHAQPTRVV